MPHCRYCLKEKKLIDAHIIPASFWELNSLLLTNEHDYPIRRPIGSYDSSILCRECDNLIGSNYDDYAKTTLIDRKGVISNPVFDTETSEFSKFYQLADKNGYSQIIKFFISVLWRASIATCKEYRRFNLGPFEEVARNIIVNNSEDNIDCFAVALCHLKNIDGPIHMVSHKLLRVEGINFYALIVASIKVYIKCDKRKTPLSLQHLIVSMENDTLMFESSSFPEGKWLFPLIKKAQDYLEKRL